MNEVYPGKNMDVPDPWYGTEKDYHEVYAMIDRLAMRSLKKICKQ